MLAETKGFNGECLKHFAVLFLNDEKVEKENGFLNRMGLKPLWLQ